MSTYSITPISISEIKSEGYLFCQMFFHGHAIKDANIYKKKYILSTSVALHNNNNSHSPLNYLKVIDKDTLSWLLFNFCVAESGSLRVIGSHANRKSNDAHKSAMRLLLPFWSQYMSRCLDLWFVSLCYRCRNRDPNRNNSMEWERSDLPDGVAVPGGGTHAGGDGVNYGWHSSPQETAGTLQWGGFNCRNHDRSVTQQVDGLIV